MTAAIKIETLDAVIEMDDVFQKAKVAAELTALSTSNDVGAVQHLHIKAGAVRDVLRAAIPSTKAPSALVKYYQMLEMSDRDILNEVARIVEFVKELNREELIESVKQPTVALKKRFNPGVSATSSSISVRC